MIVELVDSDSDGGGGEGGKCVVVGVVVSTIVVNWNVSRGCDGLDRRGALIIW